MNFRSLRLRLLFAWIVFIAVLLQVMGIGLRVLFERSITRRTQVELLADLRQIKRGMELGGDAGITIVRKPTDPQFDIEFGGRYWQVSDSSGILARSRSLKDTSLAIPAKKPIAVNGEPLWLIGPENQRLFAVVEDFNPPDGNGTSAKSLRILTAVDASEIKEAADRYTSELFTSLGILAILLFAGAVAQVFIGLRPFEELRSRLEAVRRGKAKQIEGVFPSEIMPLVSETNQLLNAQQVALTAARQRAGDLAHGLNTPLAVLSAKSRQLQREGQREVANEIDRQVESMRRHVERELARARARGASRTDYGQIDAASLLEPLISALQGLPRGQDMNWKIDIPHRLEVDVDGDDLNNMIGNLLENALKWANGTIAITARCSPAEFTIAIEDDGPGIPESDIPRMLMRGERADTTTSGSGLGLAIVCDLAELYNGDLTLSRSTLGGLSAILKIPNRSAFAT